MNRKTIRTIIFLAVFTIVGIFSFQIFWVMRAHNLQQNQFNNRVHVALNHVVKEVKQLNDDSSGIYEPVKQVSSNYFLASTNDTLHPMLLKRLISDAFRKSNLETPFEFVLYDCFTDSIIFGNAVDLKEEAKNTVHEISNEKKWSKASHYFGVYFPEKDLYLIGNMGIWIVSTIFLLLVVIFFSYTIWVILKQKRMTEVRTDFINNMTHELKTPIATISLSTESLTNPNIIENPERLNNYANIIREESNRLKNQVEKVLQMASINNKQLVLKMEKVNLHSIIEKTVDGFKVILNDKQGEIFMELKASNPYVLADKMHLTNILFNLIDNAIKYDKEKPSIIIKTTDHKKGISLSVADNGIGISKENQKQVFDKFYRVPQGDHHDVKGFGIGLNYVQSMVKKHKGKIKLKSELGKGSTFKIYFPTIK